MASGKKRTSCAKAPVNRSASSAIVVKGVYPMMLKEIEKEMAVFGAELLSKVKVERREYFFRIHFSDVYISHRISVSASQPYQLYVSFMNTRLQVASIYVCRYPVFFPQNTDRFLSSNNTLEGLKKIHIISLGLNVHQIHHFLFNTSNLTGTCHPLNLLEHSIICPPKRTSLFANDMNY